MLNSHAPRVAIFLPDLAAGGAQRSMLKLAGGIAARGLGVDVVLARASGPFLVDVPASVQLIDLGARRALTSLPAVVGYLRQYRPAALLAALHVNTIAVWARLLARVPVRVVVSERTTLSGEVRDYGCDLRVRLMPSLARCFYPWADCVVAVSKGVADDLADVTGMPRDRVHVIYNPVVTPDMRSRVEEPLLHPWFAPGEPPVVLSVGRLIAAKNYATLIQAFAQVHGRQRTRLLILGEGEQRPALEDLVRELDLKEDVNLPGFVANPYPYMQKAAVFVLSSKREGLPGVLIEALYCGIPIVATDCPSGPREILADGNYGRLVPVADVMALSEAIQAALSGEVQPAPSQSWSRFELDAVVDRYLELLLPGLYDRMRHPQHGAVVICERSEL